jgi:hypothetical protein
MLLDLVATGERHSVQAETPRLVVRRSTGPV